MHAYAHTHYEYASKSMPQLFLFLSKDTMEFYHAVEAFLQIFILPFKLYAITQNNTIFSNGSIFLENLQPKNYEILMRSKKTLAQYILFWIYTLLSSWLYSFFRHLLSDTCYLYPTPMPLMAYTVLAS